MNFAIEVWTKNILKLESEFLNWDLGPDAKCLEAKQKNRGSRNLKKGEKLHKMRELKVHFLVGLQKFNGTLGTSLKRLRSSP